MKFDPHEFVPHPRSKDPRRPCARCEVYEEFHAPITTADEPQEVSPSAATRTEEA